MSPLTSPDKNSEPVLAQSGRVFDIKVWCLAVLLMVCLVYANHFNNEFHFDDSHTIQNDPWIRDPGNIPRFFTDGTTFSTLPANRACRPLVSTSLAIDYRLSGGLKPLWFHISTFFWFVSQTGILSLWILEYGGAMVTRRSTLAALAGAAFTPLAGRAAKKATAFALIGDRYHNSDYIRTGLTRTIAKEMGVSVDFTDETSLLNAATLDEYKVLIILRDGMIWPDGYGGDESTNAAWVATGRPKLTFDPPVPQTKAESRFWMKPEQGKAVRQFVENGGAALFLHNTTHIGLSDPDFRHVLGAAYTGHPPIRTFKVKVTNADHPITQGVRDFIITDEQHYMTYDKDPKFLFLQTVNEDGLTYQNQGATAQAGWSYDYGKGRVAYLSPGHMLSDLWHPSVIRLQQNALRWVMRQK